jgi:glycosyltransferase involved in cell wall biosynthesis
MRRNPLVSTIIIFLNEAKYIQEAIASVFAQTYDHWELLLVDDGSSDESSDIARRYAEQHGDRVRYLEHDGHANRGMSASRNLGVRSANGMYISYLDGDDVWLPNKLEEQVAVMDLHPEAAMVVAPLHMWYSWTGRPEDQHRDHPYGVDRKTGRHPYHDTLVHPPQLLKLFLRHEEYMPNGYLAKRDVMVQVGTYEDRFRENYSDAVSLVKVCLTSPVFVTDKRWYLYRKHEASSTYQSWVHGRMDEEQRTYLDWVETYFKQQGVEDAELWAILSRMQFLCRHARLRRLILNTLSRATSAWHRAKRAFSKRCALQQQSSAPR